jgi:iduronate 2-sulfatase
MHHVVVLFVLATLAFTPFSTARADVKPEAGKHYTIYLLAGQSNMDGRGKSKELVGDLAGFAKPFDNVLIRYSSGGHKRKLRDGQGLIPLQPGCNESPEQFGPEIGFGHAMAKAAPTQSILIIKVSEGGTSLRDDWNPDNPKSLYHRLMQVGKETCDSLTQQGATYEIAGMAWHQGESDADQADEYAKRLAAFIDRIRADLKQPDLPFVIGEICAANKQYQGVIAAQKQVAAAVKGVSFASSQGLTTQDANVHFDFRSQIELGRRLAEAMPKPPAKPAGRKR